jgi:Transcription factor WhiB
MMPTPYTGSEPCTKLPLDLFYPERYTRAQVAAPIAACHGCPVRLECLTHALDFEAGRCKDDRHGVWGGSTPTDRLRMGNAGTRPGQPDWSVKCRYPRCSFRGHHGRAKLQALMASDRHARTHPGHRVVSIDHSAPGGDVHHYWPAVLLPAGDGVPF